MTHENSRRYKRFKMNLYVNKILDAFRNIATDPNMGRRVRWPTPPKALRKAQANMRKIQTNWWAQKVVGRMDTSEREAMRLKVAAYAVVGGKKADWGWDREWAGNYLTQPSDSHDPAVFKSQMGTFKAKGAFRRVLFSSLCMKLSSKGKAQARVTTAPQPLRFSV